MPSRRIPRSTRSFVGREAELARIVERVVGESVFLICGVAGIGKSELALRAAEQIERLGGWQSARFCPVRLLPGMNDRNLLAQLAVELGLPSRRGVVAFEDEIAPIVESLATSPTIVMLDDLHVLDDVAAERLLGYLGRHLHGSCLLATSRREITVRAPAPPACVTRLQPLDAASSRRMIMRLADTLGFTTLDETSERELVARSGGSPFYIQQQVAALPHGENVGNDVLETSLRQLDSESFAVLLHVAVLAIPIDPQVLVRTLAIAERAVEVLSRRFLIEHHAGAIETHDLVRDTIVRATAPDAVRGAHAWAACVHRDRFAANPAGATLDAIAAIRHLLAAGQQPAALAFMLAHHRAVSRAGLDHLLLDSVEALCPEHPDAAFALDLARAHLSLRQARIARAREILDAHARDPRAVASPVYHGLVASVAMRTGELDVVEAALDRAMTLAPIGGKQRRFTLAIADLRSLRGRGGEARMLLGPVGEAGGATSPTGRARWMRSFLVSLIFDSEPAAALVAARAYRAQARPETPDLNIQIALLEVVVLVELGEAVAARTIVEDIIAPAARAGALRESVAMFYASMAAWAAGELASARTGLETVARYAAEQQDRVLAGIVGHFLGRVLLDIGDVTAALAVLAQTTSSAEHMGFGMAPLGTAYMAEAELRLGRTARAAELVEHALSSPLAGRARSFVHRVAARIASAAGDIDVMNRHLAAAEAHVPADDPAAAIALELDRAELVLAAGEIAQAITSARLALAHHEARGARRGEARAAVTLATAHAIAGARGDRVVAALHHERARTLAIAHGYTDVLASCALVGAAVSGGDDELVEALATMPSDGRPFALVKAALDGVAEATTALDQVALLEALGFLARPASALSLDVDLTAGTIAVAGGKSVRGRPMLCRLLARLVAENGAPVAPHDLYPAVWGGSEYHPLRHRNTLYAAVNRLRKALAELLPERGEIVATTQGGWRIRKDAIELRFIELDPSAPEPDREPFAPRRFGVN